MVPAAVQVASLLIEQEILQIEAIKGDAGNRDEIPTENQQAIKILFRGILMQVSLTIFYSMLI